FTPIINPPETAILGVGAIKQKPVIENGEISFKEFMYLCLSFDHRVIDGAGAAKFLQTLKRLLENPYLLLFEPKR
ncbi:MAG: 2-oxo acid dehydrogenase subunit E2, partial [Candidatus Bathyarchaeia archaeon]